MEQLVDRPVRRIRAAEYHRMVEIGLFAGERLELVRGRIVEKPRLSPPHATHIGVCAQALEAAFKGHIARQQMPLETGDDSVPEPDVAVVRGSARDYMQRHPTTAALVLEVAPPPLVSDRLERQALYAAAGVPEYWVVNLAKGILEVFREPALIGDEHGYLSWRAYRRGERVTPSGQPESSLAVSELLLEL